LSFGYRVAVGDSLPARLGQNVRQLREARGLTQQQVARLAKLPRRTWSHVESGAGNPTLAVLDKVASRAAGADRGADRGARAAGRLYAKDSLRVRRQGDGSIRQLLPDPIPAC
jgi:transcriptional regulator with XRE-family HTH domain